MTSSMKCEDSPDISKRNRERDLKTVQISRTPQGKKINLDDLNLLGLHRDCSPNAYGCSQDKLEIGWGDSPEPLNIKHKAALYATPVMCKKRLESRESPKSRKGNIRPSIRPLSKPSIDVEKYVAEVKELSKRILDEIDCVPELIIPEVCKEDDSSNQTNSDPTDLLISDDITNEYLIRCSQSLENTLANNEVNSTVLNYAESSGSDSYNSSNTSNSSYGGCDHNASSASSANRNELTSKVNEYENSDSLSTSVVNDSAFEKVLQSFITEEDDWLSQAMLSAETKLRTPRKGSFMKTKSENQLSSPCGTCKRDFPPPRRSNGSRGTFRRTSSFDRFASSKEKKN